MLQAAAAPAGVASKIECSGAIGTEDPVAIVATDENSRVEFLMRDYADVSNPRTVCTFPDESARLLDANHVIVEACGEPGACALAVVDVPEVEYHWYEIPKTATGEVRLAAVARDLSAVVWTELNPDTFARTLVVRDATGDHVVADLESIVPGDCGPEPVTEAAFAHTDPYLSVIDEYIGSHLYVVQGHDVVVSLESVSSAVWSPTSTMLYYLKADDVYRWSPEAGSALVVPDLDWINPTFSPSGRWLAYAAANEDDGHDIYLADPANLASARRIATHASLPVFLNDERLWFENEGGPGCGGDEDPRQRVYNLGESTTAPTVITEVISVWPATR